MPKVFLLQEIIPNYRVPVFQRLAKLEQVDLVVFYGKPSKNKLKQNLKNAINLEGFKSVKLPLFELCKSSYQFSFLKHIISKRPDVVISGKAGAWDVLLFLLCCKILGIKLLWFSGGVPYIDEKKIKEVSESGKLSKIFGKRNPKRWLIFQADGMIVYSEHASEYYSSIGFPKEKIFVAPNSPDTESLLRYKAILDENPGILNELKKLYALRGKKIILMLGRLNRERKTDILINAFEIVQKKYPLTTLIIIGDGYERPVLERMVAEKNLQNVHFLGAIYDDETLSRYFMLCDVYVTPGVASLTVKMAMTFGKPVVSVAYGLEVHTIEHGKNGFVVDIDDFEGLADKILLLLMDDNMRTMMGDSAKDTIIKRINIHKMIEGFKKAIFAVHEKV